MPLFRLELSGISLYRAEGNKKHVNVRSDEEENARTTRDKLKIKKKIYQILTISL